MTEAYVPDWILVDNFKFTEVVHFPNPAVFSLCLFRCRVHWFRLRRRRLT